MPTTFTTDFLDLDLQLRADTLAFRTGCYLRHLASFEWQAYLDGDICCLNPDFVWVLSPLGSPLEVIRGSAEHVLCCVDADELIAIVAIARVEIGAEALFADGAKFEYVDFLERNPAALTHVLSLSSSKPNWLLDRAQRLAMAVKTHSERVSASKCSEGEIQ
jgi:hypothetical protein